MPEINLKELKNDIKLKSFSNVYLIYGEENYLKEHYLKRITEAVVGENFPEFNIKSFNGELPQNDFIEAVDSFPMMNDKTLVIIRDYDIFKANEGLKTELSEFISNPHEHCIVVIYYGETDFNPDKRTKLYKAVLKAAKLICISHAGKSELLPWIKRRFAVHERIINTELCEYLVFLCGNLMQSLIPEIEKVAAYSRRPEITRKDIDAVATPNPQAIIFNLTDALAEKDFKRAISVSEQLKESGQQAIPTLAMIAKQFRQLYSAKLIRSEDELMKLWGITNFYRAKRIVKSAHSMQLDWIKNAIILCAKTDLSLKTSSAEDEIETLIARIAAYTGAHNA